MASSGRYRKPIVGVYVGNKIVKTKGMKGLAKANKKAKTTLLFFSTKGVNFKRKKIRGLYYHYGKSRWRKSVFPIPHVLYVRGGSGDKVMRTVKRFDRMGVRRINSLVAFNKGELFKKLKKNDDVRSHLPYTKIIGDLSDARSYIRKLGDVYIKACRGRRGTKVMRVEKKSDGGYAYSYSIIGNLVSKKVGNFKRLKKVLKNFFGDREVIVQQAIELFRVDDDRPVDFRAELQRNRYGRLEIVAIPIRVGQSGSPITTHANAYKFDDYLEKLFPDYSDDEISDLKDKVYRFLKSVYRGVEKCYGKFGEIGIDFAVDKNGKIWLIECNAQSAKVSIGKAYGSSTVKRIYLNPLQYAKRIAK